MEQIYFKQLGGSRFFGTNLEKSDTDYLVIWNGASKNECGKIHTMYHSPEDGADRLLGLTPSFYQINMGFGKNLEKENLFSKYITQNIEEIKSKNIGISFKQFKDLIDFSQGRRNKELWETSRKRYTHFLLYQKIFIDYANGLPLRAALQIGEFAQFLQAARQGKVEWEEIEKIDLDFRKQFEKITSFYKDKKDLIYAKKEKQNMLQIIREVKKNGNI